MATYAGAMTEIKRLHRIPGVDARLRTIAGGWELHVKDSRSRPKQQLKALAGKTVGTWVPLSVATSAANLSKI